MEKSRLFVIAPATFLTLFAVTSSANAQETTAPAASAQATIAPPTVTEEHEKKPKVSIALERAGGVSWTKVSAKDTDASASMTVFGLGGVSVNPYSAPRIGVDAILDSGLTLGAGLSIGHYSISETSTTTTTTGSPTGARTTSTSTQSQDLGSLFIYTLTPRVGYRIPVSPEFDITPRAGLTLAGGSVSSGTSNDSAGIFALALSGEGVGAYRITKSFNLLAGVGLDYTVTATASSTGGTGNTTTSTDVKGGLFALQLWLGLGGYL